VLLRIWAVGLRALAAVGVLSLVVVGHAGRGEAARTALASRRTASFLPPSPALDRGDGPDGATTTPSSGPYDQHLMLMMVVAPLC